MNELYGKGPAVSALNILRALNEIRKTLQESSFRRGFYPLEELKEHHLKVEEIRERVAQLSQMSFEEDTLGFAGAKSELYRDFLKLLSEGKISFGYITLAAELIKAEELPMTRVIKQLCDDERARQAEIKAAREEERLQGEQRNADDLRRADEQRAREESSRTTHQSSEAPSSPVTGDSSDARVPEPGTDAGATGSDSADRSRDTGGSKRRRGRK